MDKIDLKKLWNETQTKIQENIFDEISFKRTLKHSHSKIISKVLTDLKLRIAGYSVMFLIFVSLMIYALAYLHLNFSLYTLILFSFIGLFFIIRIISISSRLILMTIIKSNVSIKECVLSFRKKLKSNRAIDFLSYLLYFYILAIASTYNFLKDIDGIKHLDWSNGFQTFVVIFIVTLLTIPWAIKYQQYQNYKKLFSSLDESLSFLNEGS